MKFGSTEYEMKKWNKLDKNKKDHIVQVFLNMAAHKNTSGVVENVWALFKVDNKQGYHIIAHELLLIVMRQPERRRGVSGEMDTHVCMSESLTVPWNHHNT